MGQASITVDIVAKVKGWQDELAKLKAAAAKVDIGSQFGQGLSKEIKNLESQVTSMGRNMTRQLTSDSSIDHFTDKINNIDLSFQNVGKTLSSVSFENLDPTYATEALKDLNAQLKAAQENLDLKMGNGFQEAINQTTFLKTALERLGIDTTTLNWTDAETKLKEGIAAMAEAIETAKTELIGYQEELRKAKQAQTELAESPVLKIADTKATATTIAGSEKDYGFGQGVNESRVKDFVDRIKGLLSDASVDLKGQGDKINEQLSNIANSKTAGELYQNLSALKQTIQSNKIMSVGDLGLGNLTTALNKLVIDDVDALTEAKNKLESKLTELKIPEEKIAEIIPNFTAMVKKGNFPEGVAYLAQELDSYKNTIADKRVEISAEVNRLESAINTTKSARGKAEYTKNVAQKALDTEYPKIIQELQAKNADLEQRIKTLESQINNSKVNLTSGVAKTGTNVSQESQRQLTANANAAKMYKTELEQVQAREQLIGKIQGVVQRWFSIYAAVRMVTNAIKSVIATVKELDTTITEIAIVTKMSQSDLWGQMETYTNMATKYAASISGVYKVSQLYYQQGLQTADVMALTEQTLKMARISGLEYAEATDYMTNAVRSFKMEMTDAQTVVDVYSAVAAKSATSVTELATAMSKTASSAQSVGATIQSTTAMMAVMIEATRESPENIGSAMKSIISRYGELKENKTGIDSEGEEYSLNKVDKALQSVGLSIHDVKGEFRDFDDVIMELAEKWDTIDKNTQRYIATIMAGNRQQSRFLALVSSYERLKELTEEAANSEDASQLQFLKTLDSIDAKAQQLQTSLQGLYVDLGIESAYKGILDWLNNIATSLGNLPDLFNLPIPAIIKIGTTFAAVANVVMTTFGLLKARVSARMAALAADSSSKMTSAGKTSATARMNQENQVTANFKTQSEARVVQFQSELQRMQNMYNSMRTGQAIYALPPGVTNTATNTVNGATQYLSSGAARGWVPTTSQSKTGKSDNTSKSTGGITKGWALTGLAANLSSLIIQGIADNMDEKTQDHRNTKATLTGISSTVQGIGLGASIGGGWGALIGGALGAIKGALEAVGIATETTEEKINNLKSSMEETSNQKIIDKNELNTLENYKKKLTELEKTKDINPDDYAEWLSLNAEIANQYPTLLSYIDEEGNKIVSLGDKYDKLIDKKKEAYEKSMLEDIQNHINAYSDMNYVLHEYQKSATNVVTSERAWNPFGIGDIISVDNDQTEATMADEWLEHINDLMTRSNGDKEVFKSLFRKDQGYSFDQALSADSYTFQDVNKAGVDVTITGELLQSIQNYLRLIDTDFDYFTSQLNDYINASLVELTAYFGEDLDFSKYGILTNQATAYLQEQWEAELAEARANNISQDQAFKIFYKKIPTLINTFNQTLLDNGVFINEDLLIEANTIFNNKGNYSAKFLTSLETTVDGVASLFTPEQFEEINEYVEKTKTRDKNKISLLADNAYEKGQISETTQTYVKGLGKKLFGGDDWTGILEDIPIKYWDGYISDIESVLKSSSYDKSAKQDVIDSIIGLRQNVLDNYDLNDKQLAAFDSIMADADFTSLTGILDFQKKLQNIGIDVDLTELTDNIIPNVEVEIDALETKLTKSMKDFESALSKAEKGMNFDDAIAMAEKLGITLSDFSFRGGKFYADDIDVDAIKEAYGVSIDETRELLQEKQTELITKSTDLFNKRVTSGDFFAGTNVEKSASDAADEVFNSAGFSELTEDEQMEKLLEQGFGVEDSKQLISLYKKYWTSFNNQTEFDSFGDYILDTMENARTDIDGAFQSYIDYATNSFLISSGRIQDFVENVTGAGGYELGEYTSSILAGNFDELPDEIREQIAEYEGLLFTYIKNAEKNVFDAALNSIKGEGPQLITVTAANKELLAILTNSEEALEEGQQILIDLHKEDIATVREQIKESTMTNSQKASAYSQLHEIEYPDITSGLSGVITNGEIAYSAAAEFVKTLGREGEDVAEVMQEYGFTFNSLTGKWIANETALSNVRAEINALNAKDNLNEEEQQRLDELNQLMDDVSSNDNKERYDSLTNVLKNYKSVSAEMILKLSDSMAGNYEEIKKEYFTANDDGTYSLDTSKIQKLIKSGNLKVGDATYNKLMEIVAEIQDDILGQISNVTGYITSGTNKTSDMQTVVEAFTKKYQVEYKAADLFKWDDVLDSYTFKPEYLQQYLDVQRELLEQAGFDTDFINPYIDNQINQIKYGVKISDYLSSGNSGVDNSQAKRTLENQMRASLASNMKFVTYEDYLDIGFEEADEDTTAREIAEAYAQQRNNELNDVIERQITTDMEAINEGGEAAIAVMRTYAENGELTASEVEAAYRAQVAPIKKVYDSLDNLYKGSVVSKDQIKILETAGFKVSADGVVTVVGDMVAAYKSIYEQMKATGEATIAELNSALGTYLDNKDGQQQVIDALGNAASMTYSELASIYTKAGKELTEDMVNTMLGSGTLKSLGGNKVMISDFNAFASGMGWSANSEEYISAFKTYNDSLIDYNKKVEDEIREEFKTLSEIDLSQGTQQVNLTRIAQAGWSDSLTELASQFGMTFKDGILTITENADFQGFVTELGKLGIAAGDLLESETQAVLDQINKQKATDIAGAFTDIADNYDSVSIEMVAALAKAMDITYDEAVKYFTDQGNGTYKISTTELKALIDKNRNLVGQKTYEDLLEVILGVQDDILASFETATSFVTNGTTSISEMQSFAQELSELTGQTYKVEELFNYDAELKVFKLNSSALQTYAEEQRKALAELGLSGSAIDDYVRSTVENLLQQNVDITSFLNANGKKEKQKQTRALLSSIKDLGNYNNIGDLAVSMQKGTSNLYAVYYNKTIDEVHDIQDQAIIDVLSAGGQNAITLLKQIKGKNVTSEEIEAVYNAAIDPLRTAAEDLTKNVGDTVTGTAIPIMRAAGFQLTQLDDGTAVIESVGDMVEAYNMLYVMMQQTAGRTQADLNSAYAKVLTAQDQKRIDALDTLENASGIAYDTFAELLTRYGADFETVMNSDAGVTTDGFGNVVISDFKKFTTYMNTNYKAGWDTTGPEYMEAYSNWVDAMIEKKSDTIKKVFQENTADALTGLTEAKVGDTINASYLEKAVGIGFKQLVEDYGAQFENGMLTITTGTDIPGMIAAIAQEAAKAGYLIPEQLAELADAVEEMLSNVTSLITGGIEGNLSNADAYSLNNWYRQQQATALGVDINDESVKDLKFTKTADGLKLANSEAIKLYNTIKNVDALQGQVVFEQLKDNLIETDDRFKSVQTTTAYTQNLTRDLRGAEMIGAGVQVGVGGHAGQVKMFDQQNGNVDLYNRNRIERPDLGEGVYSTIETATLDSRNFETDIPFVMNITPIPPDAQTFEDIMSDSDVADYVQELLDQNPIDGDALLELDKVENGGKGLIINLREEKEITDEIVAQEDERAQVLHEVAEVYESIKAGEEFDSTKIEQYKEELALAQKIQNIRATTEDSSFKFMDNEIPSGQNNPINYMESWADAYSAMKDSISGGKGKTGYMDYSDFYNLATEMGNLAEITGEAVSFGTKTLENAEAAADLIEQAAGALTVTSTGEIKVDLSKIGIDFKTGADDMNKSVNEGIKSVAKSQMDMLDSMIKMLEVIVAMEKLGDVDVDKSGSLELGEIFEVNVDGSPFKNEQGLEVYTKEFKEGSKKILDYADELAGKGDTGLQDALKSIRINGYTLGEMFQDAADNGIKNLDIGAEAYTAAMNALYQAMQSNDYDLDNIGESLYKILEESGLTNAEIDVGDKTFYIRSGTSCVIDWTNQEAIDAAETEIDAWIGEHGKYFKEGYLASNPTIQDKISKINQLLAGEKLTAEERADLELYLKIAEGEVQIKEDTDKNGKGLGTYTGSYKGQEIHGSKEDVEAAIQRAIEIEEQGFDFEFTEDGQVKGNLKLGSAEIEMRKEDGKDVYYARYNGLTLRTTDKEEALGWLASNGIGTQGTYTFNDVRYDVFVDATSGLSYSISSVDGTYICDGHSFATWEQLQEYLAFRDVGKGGKTTYDKKTNIETIIKGNATATYDFNNNTVKYTWKDPKTGNVIDFASKEAYEGYLAAYEASGGRIDAEGNPVYTIDGANVSVQVNADGTLTYTAVLNNGKKIVANDEESLKFGIAAESKINGGTVDTDKNKNISYTVLAGEVSCTVELKEGGQVETSGDAALAATAESNAKDYLAKQEIDAGATTATSSEVQVTPGENMTVTPNLGDSVALTSAIPKVTGEATTIEITSAGDGTVSLAASNEAPKLTNPIPLVKADATSMEINAAGEDSTAKVTGIPANITYDQDVPVTASKMTVSLAEGALQGIDSVAKEIADAIQAALDGIKITPTISAGGGDDGGGEGGQSGGSSGIDTSVFTQIAEAIAQISAKPFDDIVTALEGIKTDKVEAIQTKQDEIKADKVEAIQTEQDKISADNVTAIQTEQSKISADNVTAIQTEQSKISAANVTAIQTEQSKISNTNVTAIKTAEESIKTTAIDAVASKLNSLKVSISGDTADASLSVQVSVSKAKGTIGQLAYAKGKTALAGGTSTLMGELGPELVVSQGRYFIVGQNGAEFVDLDKDAIVFNHQQTAHLMEQGEIGSRGVPFTNETNAISYAKGNYPLFGKAHGKTSKDDNDNGDSGDSGGSSDNFSWSIEKYGWGSTTGEHTKTFTVGSVGISSAKGRSISGPAMASASAALAALKQLKALWQSVYDMSTSDLARLGGSGGGGGGGGSDSGTTPAEWVKMVQRWYNLTQKIAVLEKEITHQETLRSKISSDINKNGAAYYRSQRQSLADLEQQLILQKELDTDRRNYYNQRVAALKKSPFGILYDFDDKGQMQYKEGMRTFLTDLMGTDSNGKARYTNEQKYNQLLKMGFGAYMKYDSNGTEIKKDDYDSDEEYYSAVTQAAMDRIDSYASETQSLWDSIVDGENSELELQSSMNELITAIRDNQIEVEEAVLAAVEDAAQREIDELQETRDALEESTEKYINGLQNALDKERAMYESQQEDNELNKLYRKRDILMRSGGSAATLASLNNEIAAKEQDSYFNKQQEQIDAIQEASDKQLERLDTQIDILTQTLEYQKTYGLLWDEVYKQMAKTPEEIANYIMENNSENWSSSAMSANKDYDDTLFKASQYTSMRDDNQSYNGGYMTEANGTTANESRQTTVQQAITGQDNSAWKVLDQAFTTLYGDNWTKWRDTDVKDGKTVQERFESGQETTEDITRVMADIQHRSDELGKDKNYNSENSEINPGNVLVTQEDQSGQVTKHTNKKKKQFYQKVTVQFYSTDENGNPITRSLASVNKKAQKTEAKARAAAYAQLLKDAQSSKLLTDDDKKWFKEVLGPVKYNQAKKYVKSIKYAQYKEGGMAYRTGPAWLDGTPEKPEAILNADQTRILRNDILGNNSNSLMNLLLTFKEAYNGINSSTNSIPDKEESIIIENASVNMNVSQIANDYDARRAGEQALAEMMRIARKTGAANSIRR